MKTTIEKVATFAIAGPEVSAVFIDGQPPVNMPNLPIKENEFEVAIKKGIIEPAKNEDEDELTMLRREKIELIHEVERLKKELKESLEREKEQAKRIKELEGKT